MECDRFGVNLSFLIKIIFQLTETVGLSDGSRDWITNLPFLDFLTFVKLYCWSYILLIYYQTISPWIPCLSTCQTYQHVCKNYYLVVKNCVNWDNFFTPLHLFSKSKSICVSETNILILETKTNVTAINVYISG